MTEAENFNLRGIPLAIAVLLGGDAHLGAADQRLGGARISQG